MYELFFYCLKNGKAHLCYLLILFSFPLIAQVKFCPPFPREADQCFVCVDLFEVNNVKIAKLNLDQRAGIYNPVRFVFPNFMVSPSSPFINITSLTMDFGDGLGSRNITSGSTFVISYSTPGVHTLSYVLSAAVDAFGVSTHAGTLVFQTNINPVYTYPIPAPGDNFVALGEIYTPPAGIFPNGSSYNIPFQAGGKVSILYSNPAVKELRKPFIIAEGFDPILGTAAEYAVNSPIDGSLLGYGSVRWDVILTGRSESFDDNPTLPGISHTPQFALFPALISELQSRGYDIVFVDFANAGTFIEANASFLIEVIDEINNRKIGSEQNVVVGVSMGGIVARYALAKMEADGKSHCTGTFFTFDTPHNGANIPLALQALGWFYHATGVTNELWDALNTPAAKQMIISNLGKEVQDGKVTIKNNNWSQVEPLSFDELTSPNYTLARNILISELASLGWPKIPRKLAILDGMKNGTALSNQGYGPGGKFYDSSIYANSSNLGTVFKIAMRSNTSNSNESYSLNGLEDCTKHSITASVNNSLLVIGQPSDFDPCNILVWGSDKVPHKFHSIHLISNEDLPALDNAPGGQRSDLVTLNARIKTGAESTNNVTFNNPVLLPLLCFVPTWSSLAMATPLNNENLFVNLSTSEFQASNLPNTKVPNFDFFYAPPANLRHVELDGGSSAFILDELDQLGTSLIGGNLDEEYNYGLKIK